MFLVLTYLNFFTSTDCLFFKTLIEHLAIIGKFGHVEIHCFEGVISITIGDYFFNQSDLFRNMIRST